MFAWFNFVAVGNIPYDATEEQLIQICEEVGPVVSFRLVIDRETGKPKGYGFCEYKDEETALSARRNLQGYEINGRQLRVDFAENDKNTDRNREQKTPIVFPSHCGPLGNILVYECCNTIKGRGGPGMVANVDPQKQFGGPTVTGDSGSHQPIGLQVAMAAASVMAGVLGGAQGRREMNQNGLQGQPALYSDPLTLHLAKMSRNQLNEVMFELKVMAMQNKEQARQLLLANPQLAKAVFEAQIMLEMVTPQMLQMPNIQQASGQPLSQDGQQGQQPVVQTLPGLPPLAQNKMQFGLMPRVQEGQISSLHPNSLAHNQYSALPQLPTHPQVKLPQLPQNQVLQQGSLPGHSGISILPSICPLPLGNASSRPHIPVAASSFAKRQMQSPLIPHQGQATAANLGHNSQLFAPNATLQPSLLTRPLLSNQNFQPGTSILSGIPDMINKDADRPAQVTNASTWVPRVENCSSLPSIPSMVDTSDPMSGPSKLMKLDEGRTLLLLKSLGFTSVGSGDTENFHCIDILKSCSWSAYRNLPPDVESALLQQVLNLTPEQLSSLPPDQQQQVLQLQQILRARLTKAYQTAAVLFEVLKAVNLTESLEVADEILETHSKVEEKIAIYVPYNILPLDLDSSNQAIMKYHERLPWPKGQKKKADEDILDWLQAMFGFQKDNVANQREHLILLLANMHIQRFQPDQQPRVQCGDVEFEKKIDEKISYKGSAERRGKADVDAELGFFFSMVVDSRGVAMATMMMSSGEADVDTELGFSFSNVVQFYEPNVFEENKKE
ncbi:hypothetical protein TEA_028956 [Camellia sinensis var. sinensis]|uniref:RRM domain-containing protein n=1 Tax=Camellia sinensis var. sinensis TaxID=542762 RepID=A0A4S4E8H3_CAMSN|nr:hypothetical protein TEA_028956 [Camellia sinensis var. sinensis]